MARCMESSLGLAGRRWWSKPTQTPPRLPCSLTQNKALLSLLIQYYQDPRGRLMTADRRGSHPGHTGASGAAGMMHALGEYWYKLHPHRTRAYRRSHPRPEHRAEKGARVEPGEPRPPVAWASLTLIGSLGGELGWRGGLGPEPERQTGAPSRFQIACWPGCEHAIVVIAGSTGLRLLY